MSVVSLLPPFYHSSFPLGSSPGQNVLWYLGLLSHALCHPAPVTLFMPLSTSWSTWCNQGPSRAVFRRTKNLLWSSEKQIVILSSFQTRNVLGSICSFSENMLCAQFSASWKFWVKERSLPLSTTFPCHLFIYLVTNPEDSQNYKGEDVIITLKCKVNRHWIMQPHALWQMYQSIKILCVREDLPMSGSSPPCKATCPITSQW